MAGEQPQPWDTAKVTLAFSDAVVIVEALSADHTGEKYRAELETLVERRLESAVSDQDFVDRLAYVLYGFALFGVGALTLAEESGQLGH